MAINGSGRSIYKVLSKGIQNKQTFAQIGVKAMRLFGS